MNVIRNQKGLIQRSAALLTLFVAACVSSQTGETTPNPEIDRPPTQSRDVGAPDDDGAPSERSPDVTVPHPESDAPQREDESAVNQSDIPTSSADDDAPPPSSPDDVAAAPQLTPFTRYPAATVHSPLTANVIRSIRAIRTRGEARDEHVFMKVGASETADRRNLRCLWGGDGSPWEIDLGAHEQLRATLEHFQKGRVRGRHNPFIRESEAAKVGVSTHWTFGGSPSPFRREVRATNAAWALISFGTNDVRVAKAPSAGIQNYYQRLSRLVQMTLDEDILPILFTPGPRRDSQATRHWSPYYVDVTRALAQQHQVPLVNILEATSELPEEGLVRDGVHGNSWVDEERGHQPCVFIEEALQYHYNRRNLLTLEALDRALNAARGNLTAEPEPLGEVDGEGTLDEPYLIDRERFIHQASTADSPSSVFDHYPACDAELTFEGPEVLYRLELDEPRALRILALSSQDVDVDVQLLATEGSEESCQARDTRMIAGTLATGTYTIVVDTYTNRRGRERPGRFLLIVAPCAEEDAACREEL